MLMHMAKVENARMVRKADGAMLMSIPVTREMNMMASSSPRLPVKLNQILISPVFVMEKKIFMVLVVHVRMVGLSAMLIKMPTVKI